MTRAILSAFLTVTSGLVLLTNQGCGSTGIGDPCVPEQEYDPTFAGFSEKEVNVESKSFQCLTRLCLVNHFRGRVSCPGGQDSQGIPPSINDASGKPFEACTVPGNSDQKIEPDAGERGNCVPSQCEDRQAERAVYCSCRCANANGETNDGSIYCACPDGFTCEQLVSSTGRGNEGLTGGYCVKSATSYNSDTSCANSVDTTDPTGSKCALD